MSEIPIAQTRSFPAPEVKKMKRLTPEFQRFAWRTTVPLAIGACILATTLHVGRSVHAGQTSPQPEKSIALGAARPDALYAVTVTVKDPAQLQGNDAVRATIRDAQGAVESKWLHAADLDFYLTLRPRSAGPVAVDLSAASGVHAPDIAATMSQISESAEAVKTGRGVIAAAPND